MGRPCPVSERQKEEIIAAYLGGESTHSLSRRFFTSRSFLKDLFASSNVPMRSIEERQHKFEVKHGVFSNPNKCENAAYWCGFLMADGCVSQQAKSHVIIVVSKEDKKQLIKFRDFAGSQHAVMIVPERKNKRGVLSREMARIDLVSNQMADDLAKVGITPRKTHTAKAIGLEHNRHFWRGCIDGDGSLGFGLRKGLKPRPVIQFVGTEMLVKQFAEFCRSITNTNASPHRSKSQWAFSLTCQPCHDVVQELYRDCETYLDRKMNTAKMIMEWKSSQSNHF